MKSKEVKPMATSTSEEGNMCNEKAACEGCTDWQRCICDVTTAGTAEWAVS